jgi:uncharacterized protein (TIGR02001 family)
MKTQGFATACAAGTLMVASLGNGNAAEAQSPHSVSANIGVVSNYIWRGVTQTQNDPAVQGGLDYSHESGLYVGAWVSNIDWGTPDPNYELDLYGGFGGSVNEDFSYDINTTYFAYPDGRDSDFWEIGASGTFRWVTLGLAYTVAGENEGGLFDDGDIYYYGSFEYSDLPYDLGISLRTGYYDFRHDRETLADGSESPSADYWNYGASLSKAAGEFGTFSLNWDQNNGDPDSPGGYDDDPEFWVGWNKEF